MKILAYKSEVDFNFDAIVRCIAETKYEIGYMSQKVDEKAINEFAPDIIIHNIKDIAKFPIKNNIISINLNETSADNSFSFKNVESKNYLRPFVSIKNLHIEPNQEDFFKSDLVYIGSPIIFKEVLQFLCQEDSGINFKFFSDRTHNIRGYCGMCNAEDYLKFYNKAKASLVHHRDINRIMDIIISDGNPIVYEDPKKCINDIKDALDKNKKFTVDGYSKKEILQNNTSYDRAAEIFTKIGLKKVAEELLRNKNLKLD